MQSARPIVSIKARTNSITKQTTSNIQQELKKAQNQVKMLRAQNEILLNRVKQLQNQQNIIPFLNEQLAFRKGEQNTMTSLLANSEQIAKKLRQKVKSLQEELRVFTHKQLNTTVQNTAKINESFENQYPNTRIFRGSQTRRSQRSGSCESQQRENHSITPKSQVRIDMAHIFEDNLAIRKKVFL